MKHGQKHFYFYHGIRAHLGYLLLLTLVVVPAALSFYHLPSPISKLPQPKHYDRAHIRPSKLSLFSSSSHTTSQTSSLSSCSCSIANSPSSPPPPIQPPRPHPSHPALAVSNINTFIKVTLDIEKGQYITWSELFKIHARAYQVLDHIIPPSAATMKQYTSLQDTDPDLWSRVDAIVLQWIYGTISEDLLNTILERDSTAALAWNRLRDIFSDNKNSRALYLEQEFSKVQMEHFADASSYCQHLKSLSDQLSNVGSPVTNERLVLQLVSGLTDAYASVGSQICHGDSLPPFYKARSMLVLEETARTKKAAQTSSNSAFFVSPVAHSSGHTAGNPFHHRPNHTSSRVSPKIQML